MIDVGAHHGGSLLPYAYAGWKIIAFEPDPYNRSQLKKRAFSNRVLLQGDAVSDEEIEKVTFYASKESTGISSLSPFRDSHEKTAEVRVVTLRSAMKRLNIESVNFLKIDTEGHDLMALKGFPWEVCTPEVVLCEFEDNKTKPLGYDYKEMADYLVSKGYRVLLSEWKPIVAYGVSHGWRSIKQYPCDLTDERGWGNLVAIKDEESVERMLAFGNECSTNDRLG